jgi:flagellar M-ring protein FliF
VTDVAWENPLQGMMAAWANLDLRRRVIAALAALAMFAAVLAMARGGGPSTDALLYAGLEPAAAGEVIAALDQRGVAYRVQGDAIYVAAGERDSLRLSLAGEGLPAAGTQGYELLDQLTGFGTTAQMFDAAYWRAKEGELARTIQAMPGVRTARVHISSTGTRPFQRDAAATASVFVTMAGASLTADQAAALRYLVASAVSGMAPGDVAIIDGDTGLVVGDDAGPGASPMVEDLRARAERLLAARVGPGNAVVELSVETVTESETILERRLDPESRVAISSEVEESAASETGGASGAVTVASNLPDGEAAAGGGGQSETTDSRTITNWEVSETSRELVRTPGAVRRLTVAVLVNEIAVTSDDGTVTSSPRSEEELAALGALVASAVGLDEARGDVLTIRSMAFEGLAPIGSEAAPAGLAWPALDLMSLIRLGVLALVALVLGLFVVRPILASGRAAANQPALPLPPPDPGLDVTPGLPNLAAVPSLPGAEPEVIEAEILDPVTRLRRLIEERQDESLRILQSWIEEPDGKEKA